MKTTLTLTLIPLFLKVAALSGNSHHPHVIVETQPRVIAVAAPAPIIVSVAPPAPIVETIKAAPQPNYVCIPGKWNERWVCRSHQLVERPSATAVWQPRHTHWSDHHRCICLDQRTLEVEVRS